MIDNQKLGYTCIFIYLTICTYKDLTVQTSAEKEIPMTKVGLNANIGPTIKFLYCYSCGYKKAFEDYSNIIRQKYPDISITGANYDPPGLHMIIARSLGFLKMVIIVSVLSGINLFAKFGLQTPYWWTWCTANKLWSCMMIFFMTNALEGHFISTGAFEITLNDMPVWSKLETGRIPQPPELFQIIDNHMNFGSLDIKTGFPK
ncbi:thioredoxin reductase-like selenoprotein T homolog CG3887 [Cimex lectularius]|uniref:SelT-like protein n=1 Tax=Cimex lectularius TaxID=79782 RepID=A0A8I6RQN9_CIMLE|nr:thioredoxin reductase-like selenoprotein T homolog CG3887 [Cimex lectularius]